MNVEPVRDSMTRRWRIEVSFTDEELAAGGSCALLAKLRDYQRRMAKDGIRGLPSASEQVELIDLAAAHLRRTWLGLGEAP